MASSWQFTSFHSDKIRREVKNHILLPLLLYGMFFTRATRVGGLDTHYITPKGMKEGIEESAAVFPTSHRSVANYVGAFSSPTLQRIKDAYYTSERVYNSNNDSSKVRIIYIGKSGFIREWTASYTGSEPYVVYSSPFENTIYVMTYVSLNSDTSAHPVKIYALEYSPETEVISGTSLYSGGESKFPIASGDTFYCDGRYACLIGASSASNGTVKVFDLSTKAARTINLGMLSNASSGAYSGFLGGADGRIFIGAIVYSSSNLWYGIKIVTLSNGAVSTLIEENIAKPGWSDPYLIFYGFYDKSEDRMFFIFGNYKIGTAENFQAAECTKIGTEYSRTSFTIPKINWGLVSFSPGGKFVIRDATLSIIDAKNKTVLEIEQVEVGETAFRLWTVDGDWAVGPTKNTGARLLNLKTKQVHPVLFFSSGGPYIVETVSNNNNVLCLTFADENLLVIANKNANFGNGETIETFKTPR